MENRIMFAGASGTGKTTLAIFVSRILDIPFISGSYSDLVPSTREEKHSEMLSYHHERIIEEDYKLLSLRYDLFKRHTEFVSDRSFYDNIAYFIYKISPHITTEETNEFIYKALLYSKEVCNKLIFIPFTKRMIQTWEVEDNNKRILNGHFQHMISNIFYDYIYPPHVPGLTKVVDHNGNTIIKVGPTFSILILNSISIMQRQSSIQLFVEGKYE
jgi:hypothetical protein